MTRPGGVPGTPPWRLLVEETLPSTSDHLRRLAEEGAPDFLAVLARRQTAGRARGGRSWTSPVGNLYLSVLLRPDGPAREAAQWSLLAGVALAEAAAALEPAPPGPLRLKWPNDLLRDGAKVAGILTEASLLPEGGPDRPLAWLIFGIGVNLATAPTLSDGRRTGTLARPEEPPQFAARLLDRIAHWRGVQSAGGFAPVRAAWQTHGPETGMMLRVRTGEAGVGWLEGRYAGLAEDGSLLLAPAAGSGPIRRIAAGEVEGGGG